MTDKAALEQEIRLVWEAIATEQPSESTRIDVQAELAQAEQDTANDACEHLSLWLILLDEALHCMLTLYSFTRELSTEKNTGAITSQLLVARACALMVAIRKLINAGLEDIARVLTRTLLETLDLTLVTLADEEFAERYHSALNSEDYDANKFWRENISNRALEKRLKRSLRLTNMKDEQVKYFFKYRQELKKQFSSSVHSSASSALFSGGIPSLSRPGMISPSILGHVNVYSPDHLSFLIMEIHRFGVIIFHLINSDKSPTTLKNAEFILSYSSLLTAFLTLQEMTQKYSDVLPPPFYFPDTEEGT